MSATPDGAAGRAARAHPIHVARLITRLNIGGPAIQAISLSRDLAASGFSTMLVHGQLGEGEGDMSTLMSMDDLKSTYVPSLVRPISPVNDLVTLWRLYRLFLKWQPAIVHTHMAKAGSLGRLAAVLYNLTAGRRRRARLVHTYHGHVFEGYFGSLTSRAFIAVERWLGRRTDALIAISPQVREAILQTFRVGVPLRTHLIPLGFDLARFFAIDDAARARARALLGIPVDAVVVTTVGRLTAIKQQSSFVEMAQAVAKTDSRCLFLIVGDGELRESLEAQVARAGIAPCTRFLGWHGNLDVVYGATDIFVLTSRNEGTPVALIEAMASGTAAVSTDVGGVRDVITNDGAGVRVPFGDLDALSEAVQRLVASATLRRAMGRAAREVVGERFDIRRLVSDIRELYERLLKG